MNLRNILSSVFQLIVLFIQAFLSTFSHQLPSTIFPSISTKFLCKHLSNASIPPLLLNSFSPNFPNVFPFRVSFHQFFHSRRITFSRISLLDTMAWTQFFLVPLSPSSCPLVLSQARISLFVHVPLVCASAALRAASRGSREGVSARVRAALGRARRSYILTWQLVLRRMLLSLVVRTHARSVRFAGVSPARTAVSISAGNNAVDGFYSRLLRGPQKRPRRCSISRGSTLVYVPGIFVDSRPLFSVLPSILNISRMI